MTFCPIQPWIWICQCGDEIHTLCRIAMDYDQCSHGQEMCVILILARIQQTADIASYSAHQNSIILCVVVRWTFALESAFFLWWRSWLVSNIFHLSSYVTYSMEFLLYCCTYLGGKSEKCFGIRNPQIFSRQRICLGSKPYYHSIRLWRSRGAVLCDNIG